MEKIISFVKLLQVWKLCFPSECIICGSKERLYPYFLCESCSSQMQFTENLVYDSAESNHENEFTFDFAQAVFPLTKIVRVLIHNFKYNEMTKAGKYLAVKAAEFMEKRPFPEKIDFVVPIPLHSVKKRMRGFNQAEVLSKVIAQKHSITHVPNLVLRRKFTQTQTMLKREERQKNVSGAFFLNSKYTIKDKVVLIVDDVFTTGSTANSISSLLKKNEVKRVFILTIARA